MDSPTLPPNTRSPPALIDLPFNVVDEILRRLSIEDLVRTSILSRSWRHRWHSVSDLDLNDNEIYSHAIDHVLLLHHSSIRSCSLAAIRYLSDANRWLLVLSRSGHNDLRSLYVNLGMSRTHSLLPSTVFSFRGLHSLRLTLCSISSLPLDSPSFLLLHDLYLCGLSFQNDSHLPMLISQCPALEELSLNNLKQPCGRLHIRNPNLRSFTLVRCEFRKLALVGRQTPDSRWFILVAIRRLFILPKSSRMPLATADSQ